MNEWLHNLPVWWMTLVVFAITYLAAGVIFAIIVALETSDENRGRVRRFFAGSGMEKRVVPQLR